MASGFGDVIAGASSWISLDDSPSVGARDPDDAAEPIGLENKILRSCCCFVASPGVAATPPLQMQPGLVRPPPGLPAPGCAIASIIPLTGSLARSLAPEGVSEATEEEKIEYAAAKLLKQLPCGRHYCTLCKKFVEKKKRPIWIAAST